MITVITAYSISAIYMLIVHLVKSCLVLNKPAQYQADKKVNS